MLLLDGSNYKIRRGTSLQNVSLDENGTIKSFSVEQVDYDYKYDSSSLMQIKLKSSLTLVLVLTKMEILLNLSTRLRVQSDSAKM